MKFPTNQYSLFNKSSFHWHQKPNNWRVQMSVRNGFLRHLMSPTISFLGWIRRMQLSRTIIYASVCPIIAQNYPLQWMTIFRKPYKNTTTGLSSNQEGKSPFLERAILSGQNVMATVQIIGISFLPLTEPKRDLTRFL